jgi:hypothetical protein
MPRAATRESAGARDGRSCRVHQSGPCTYAVVDTTQLVGVTCSAIPKGANFSCWLLARLGKSRQRNNFGSYLSTRDVSTTSTRCPPMTRSRLQRSHLWCLGQPGPRSISGTITPPCRSPAHAKTLFFQIARTCFRRGTKSRAAIIAAL